MRASRGALFLAPCLPPRGPCLLLLYFGDPRCMMGSQRGPLTLSTGSRGELACSWSGVGCRVGLEWLHGTTMFGCPLPPAFAFLITQELLLHFKSSGPKLGLNSRSQLQRQQHFFHLPLIFASKCLHGDHFHFLQSFRPFLDRSLL